MNLKEAIVKGKLEEVIEYILGYAQVTSDNRLLNTATLISTRIQGIKDDKIKGISTRDRERMERAQVVESLLSVIDMHNVPNKDFPSKPEINNTPLTKEDMPLEILMPTHEVKAFIERNKSNKDLVTIAVQHLGDMGEYEMDKIKFLGIPSEFDPGNERGEKIVNAWKEFRSGIVSKENKETNDFVTLVRNLAGGDNESIAKACEEIYQVNLSDEWKKRGEVMKGSPKDIAKRAILIEIENYISKL